ncbi:MAG: beta-ketoacyl synthase N-terminal-like domain-containing protein [Acidobacteriota bacterium]|nr:beta-ketoacyl synthase N-terminal-like domain-containing protein [Acidobacteriota bacterium]
MKPQPLNVAGDLYIAGECLSSGYMGSPALTASKFLPDPWSEIPGGRMYRTGDRSRYWADGNLEFLGRLDAQVKVRGYRIELGEIAAALTDHESVCDAAVIVREDTPGDQRLVAYMVPEEGMEVSGGELRPYLQQKLPDYMVPSRYVTLDSLPVTANGKLDREALPEPEGDRPELEQAYVDPESEVEQTIADLWQQVLGVDRVGRHDNFFELGGHSLLLTQIHLDLQQKHPELTLVDLFTYPTVASLAEHLSRAAGAAAEVEQHFERARARVQKKTVDQETDIAIVGMALRYPKAVTPEEFWANLTAGLECIEFFTLEEVLEAGVDPELARHPDYVRAEGTVADVDRFDWRFFGYGSKDEVELLDPQQRIFMECCWEAFERAGYNPYDTGSVVGVFGGVNISSYLFNALYDYDPYNVMSSFLTRIGLLVGNQNDYLCTRVAYHFDLKGPAFTVQTACSTATVASHLACQSLMRGECDMALAGGVQIRVPQNMGYLYQEGGFPSPDGHCRSFDAQARGNVHGNGAGVMLLKRLSDAQRDGDHIHAVIKGSALANDGSVKVGFTAPGVSGQARAAAEALAVAGVGADDIGYLEATGTATELGDPIEIEALSKAYTLTTERRGFLPIGSVKSNIGHTDAASGVAALIKTALVLENHQIPPSLHYQEPNPRIDFDSSPFFVNTDLRDFPRNGEPRRAAVHTYAVGGTNTHFVLEEPPAPVPGDAGRTWQLLPLSARTSTALGALGERFEGYLAGHPEVPLADVAFTLQTGRKAWPLRRWVLARDAAEAAEVLSTLPEHRTGAAFDAGDGGRVALVFPDLENLDAALVAELYEAEPSFRKALDEALAILREQGLKLDPVSLPASPEPDARAFAAAVAAVQVALGELWRTWGLEPNRVVGWGSGELPAAVAAGALSAAEALNLALARGAVLAAAEIGEVMEIYASAEQTVGLLAELDGLETVYELPEGPCRVRGASAAVDALETRLEELEVDAFRLGPAPLPATAGAALEAFRERAETAAAGAEAPRARLLLASRGSAVEAAVEAADVKAPGLWLASLKAPARPAAALATALPGTLAAVTAALGGEGLAEAEAARQASESSDSPAAQSFELLPALAPSAGEGGSELPASARLLATLGNLWLAGAPVSWRGLYQDERRLRLPLPTYPFERERIWAEPQMDRQTAMANLSRDPGQRRPLEEWFYAPSWNRSESSPAVEEIAPEGAWLCFCEAGTLGDELGQRLSRAGRRVITVRASESFEAQGEDAYAVHPLHEADYLQLLSALGDLPIAGAVHGWGLETAASADAGGLEDLLAEEHQRSFWSQMFWSQAHLARAWAGSGRGETLRCELITSGAREVVGDEELDPALALPLAASLSLPREYPNLLCRAIDVAAGVSGPRRELLLDQLTAELLHRPSEPAVAYRGRHRWVESFQQLAPPPESAPLPISGLVLLVGGAGPLELAAAESLAAQHRDAGPDENDLILAVVGASGLPPRDSWEEWRRQAGDDDPAAARIDRLLALEGDGVRVLAEAVDLGAPAAVAAAVARLEEVAGKANSEVQAVIYGAPELSPELTRTLGELDADFLAYRLRGRLEAFESVSAALADRPAIHLLASTVAAVLGGLAVAVDCAADLYLGLAAQARSLAGSAGRFLCVDWDAVRYGHESAETAARLPEDAVKSAEVPQALGHLLRLAATAEGSRVVLSTTDLEARRRRSFGGDEVAVGEDSELRARPEDLPEPYTAPETEIQSQVAEIWAEVLGLDRVGLHDNYFDLGGNSLMATQLVSRLRGTFRVELALQSFFDGATVADVAESIEVARWTTEVQAEEAGGAVAVGAGEEVGEI